MAKDLTTSRLDRQNILNNEIAVDEIQIKSGICVLFNGKTDISDAKTGWDSFSAFSCGFDAEYAK